MARVVLKNYRKLTTLGIIILIVVVIASAKFMSSYRDTSWQDLSDTLPTITTPTENIGQIEGSLEGILKQYEELITSSNQTRKNQLLSNLDNLYQLSAIDYENAHALRNFSNNDPTLNDLAQATTFLSSSIFEMKDGLMILGAIIEQ
ncbi:hypothetical protein [Desulfosporosinus sp. FKB]|uniref:hypothetical protein n=1 Tax=Desulfosporosinus sp. FKB TaxID=1969835 RepID=UPI000B49DEFB|nr:hypothetical protein [Desulfosporosinus sp. FKB]